MCIYDIYMCVVHLYIYIYIYIHTYVLYGFYYRFNNLCFDTSQGLNDYSTAHVVLYVVSCFKCSRVVCCFMCSRVVLCYTMWYYCGCYYCYYY